MIDQPLVPEVKATVYKQFRLKWEEVGKSAVLAGLTIVAGMLYVAINDQRFPTQLEFIAALKAGFFATVGSLFRYYFNGTTTVIKGQIDPTAIVTKSGIVVTKDAAP